MAAPGRHAANDVDPDAALVATVNRWWDEGSGDREQLRRLASRIGLQARFYVLPHGTDELLDFSSREVMVEPADEHGGWFGCTSADPDELFLLPADHRYFSGITSRTLVRRLFHGTDGTQGMAGCRARQVARLRRRSGTRFEIVAPGTLSSPGSPERIDDVPGYERFREHPEDPARIAEQLVQLRSELREVQNALRLLRARVESESDAEIPHP
jgi:hypothetical protein